jgi:Bacteriophage protein of unknown function (DUF646).
MELKEYIRRMGIVNNDFQKFKKQFLLQQAISIRNEAIRRTPVDTGALRSSWYVGNEKFELKTSKKGKVRKFSESEASIKSVGINMTVVIGNSQKYASFQEYGTSKGIEPKNMLSVPVERYYKNCHARFSRDFRYYLKERGVF